MRIDAKLHRAIEAMFTPEERVTIKGLLSKLDYKLGWGYVCAREIKGAGSIDRKLLVITQDMIGFGWPMSRSIWMRIN